MRTLASMSEIVRVGGWALRGAGFPFGVAERGSRLLAFTEAVHGGAVRDVCAHEPIIGRAASRKGVAHARHTDGGWDLDGGGRHLIEAGPPLADLATSDARLRGQGHARLSNVVGFVFITALADLLAQRRLTGLCVYRADEESWLPPSVPRAGWILFGRRGNRPVFATGAANDPLALHIEETLGETAFASVISADLAEVSSRGAGYLAAVAFGCGHETGDRLFALLDRPEGEALLRDYAGQVAASYRDGVPMEPQDLQDLYDLEIRTWAPTSERSRSQAGYGKF
jgi:hypothetical protein